MNLWILIIIESFFLMVAYALFEGDCFAPPVITILVVLAGTIMVIPSLQLWNVTISVNTIAVMLIGFLSCNIGGILAKLISNSRGKRTTGLVKKALHWHRSVEGLVLFLTLLLTILYMYNAIRVGILNGGSGLGAIAYMKSAYTSDSQGAKMNPLIRQGFKFVMAIAYISTYYFSNNVLIMKEKICKNLSYLVAFICGCVITIFSGSRTDILRLVSALILDYVVIIRVSSGYQHKGKSRKSKIGLFHILKKFLPLLLAAVVIGFMSRAVVKVSNTGGSEIASVIGYASFYVGSPIQVLNIKLTYFSNMKELVFGTSTKIPDFVYLGNLDYGGNVATIFGSCIQYNGILKMVLYLLITYFIGTALYYHLYDTTANQQICRKRIIIYSYCYFVFTMAYYSICTIVLFEFSSLIVLGPIFLMYKPLRKLVIRVR